MTEHTPETGSGATAAPPPRTTAPPTEALPQGRAAAEHPGVVQQPHVGGRGEPAEPMIVRTGELAGGSGDPAADAAYRSRVAGTQVSTRPATLPDGSPRPLVTIVLPCYNEGAHVLREIDRITAAMNATDLSYELLCIDDASTDDTLQVLRDAATRYDHLRIMPFRRNGGSGTARRIGTQQAYGDIVVWTDADMTYENEKIPDLVRFLLEDASYDQVVGARTTEEGTHKWARVPAKFVIRKVAEWLSKEKIPDLNSGLRAFRRDVALPYLRLLPAGFSCVTTITLAFLMNQHDVAYMETSYAKREGVSKFHFFRDAYRYILQVLRMIMYFDPLRVLMPIALWLFVIGVVKGVVDIARYQSLYFPANTVLLIVSGILVGSLALLADLVVRSRDGV